MKRIERWQWLIAAAGTALFVLRIGLEGVPQRPLWAAACALLCVVAGYLIRKTSVSLLPVWVLWVYVLSPWAESSLAGGVAAVALLALAIDVLAKRHCWPTVVDGIVFASAFALYLLTLAPTILPADSGEFQIVGPVLGVAHPPGYALFTLIAKLFSLLPMGEVAWRVNLMGAVTGAITVVIVGRTARQITGSAWAGLAAASALSISTTFWAQSTTANIRALIMLLTALCFYFLSRFIRAPVGSSLGAGALTGLALSFGLLISHHYPQAAFAPVFGIVVLWHDPRLLTRFRDWPRYLGAFLIPFLADLYIVARAISGASFGTDELVSAGRIADHLLGRGFSGDMFAFLRFDRVLWERFLVVGNILHFQFGTVLLIAAAIGLGWLAWQERKQAVLLGGVFAVMSVIVATYRAPQSVEYLMPAYVPVALGIGCAVGLIAHLVTSRLARALLTALLLLPILCLGQEHLTSYVLLHHDRSARTYAESVLLNAPPETQILSNWHWYTPLRYLQLVEGQRPDVQVTYVYPQGATEMPQAWRQRIEHELAQSDKPLIVTNYYPTYLDLSYRFVPHGEAFLVQDKPTYDVPADLMRIDADLAEGGDQIRVLGYRLHRTAAGQPGDWITVDLAWQPLVRLERGYSFSVQLIGPSGIPVGQHDRRHDAAPTYEPGEVLVDRYRFPVHLSAAPGTYHVIATVYHTRADGSWQRMTLPDRSDLITLSTLAIEPAASRPVTLHPQSWSFSDGPTLVGVDYDDTLPAQRRVYLHWRVCPEPATVQLIASGQPVAQGSVPAAEGRGYVTTVLDVPPAAQDLRLTLLWPETGALLSRRGPWGLALRSPAPLPRPRSHQHYMPYGGKLTLVGVHTSKAWSAGQEGRIALSFLSLRPIVRDYIVSVRVNGIGASDSVPALGALPTFKWIRGSQILDVHLLAIPTEATGQIVPMITVYDAFTSETLAPLDERIARLGVVGVPAPQIIVR